MKKKIKVISLKEVLSPDIKILVALGSMAIHLQEADAKHGHAFDWIAAKSLIEIPEVQEWLSLMDKLALLPKPR